MRLCGFVGLMILFNVFYVLFLVYAVFLYFMYFIYFYHYICGFNDFSENQLIFTFLWSFLWVYWVHEQSVLVLDGFVNDSFFNLRIFFLHRMMLNDVIIDFSALDVWRWRLFKIWVVARGFLNFVLFADSFVFYFAIQVCEFLAVQIFLLCFVW